MSFAQRRFGSVFKSRYWWAFLLRVRQRLQLDQLQQHQKRVQQLRRVLAVIG